LLHLELLGSLNVTAWCAGMLELVGSLVVIATLGNTELVALGAQEVREYWVVSHWLHNISLVDKSTYLSKCWLVERNKNTYKNTESHYTSIIPHIAYNVKFVS
jgi:hypothetical protein